jgi:hypothetical protein
LQIVSGLSSYAVSNFMALLRLSQKRLYLFSGTLAKILEFLNFSAPKILTDSLQNGLS